MNSQLIKNEMPSKNNAYEQAIEDAKNGDVTEWASTSEFFDKMDI